MYAAPTKRVVVPRDSENWFNTCLFGRSRISRGGLAVCSVSAAAPNAATAQQESLTAVWEELNGGGRVVDLYVARGLAHGAAAGAPT